jgi:hypothetical protein
MQKRNNFSTTSTDILVRSISENAIGTNRLQGCSTDTKTRKGLGNIVGTGRQRAISTHGLTLHKGSFRAVAVGKCASRTSYGFLGTFNERLEIIIIYKGVNGSMLKNEPSRIGSNNVH